MVEVVVVDTIVVVVVVVVVCAQTVETPVCKLTAKKLLGSVIVPTTVQESELES